MKKFVKLVTFSRFLIPLLLTASLLLGACARTGPDAGAAGEAELTMTLEELAGFDGLEDRRAYIAVDGIIYDVTDIAQWKDGIHQGRYQAGQDYSQEIRNEAPHGTGMLSRAVKVGKLID